MKKRTKQILVSVAMVMLVLAALAGVKAAQFGALAKAGESFSPPPEAVTTAVVESAQWQSKLSVIGSTVAVQGVTISPEVGGTVEAIAFESGQTVKKGDLLVRLDTSVERAELASATSAARLAELDLERAETLFRDNVNSPAEVDAARARSAQAEAAVQNVRAAIAKKVLRAPFSGRLGIRQVNLGEVLEPGRPIVTLQSYRSLYVDFFVPQQSLALISMGHSVRVTTNSFPERDWQGKVETVDAQVDPSTRNVRIRARVESQDGTLIPGMFVDVEVSEPGMRQVLTIPAAAVLHAPYGDSVFLLKEGSAKDGSGTGYTVEQTFIRLGERRGDLVAVTSGLTANQTIVSTGAFKLRNGMRVVVHNELAPEVTATPTPDNE